MPHEDFPKWIRQALSRRFDEHANASAKHHDIYNIRKKLDQITEDLREKLEPAVFLKILEWEEVVNRQHSIEKEWLYIKGVKDGIRLVNPIYCYSGRNQSKL